MNHADWSPENTPGETELVDELTAFRDRAAKRLENMKRIQTSLSELVTLPSAGTVSVTFDELGILNSLEIDPTERTGLDGKALNQEINYAIARANQQLAPRNPEHTDESQEAVAHLLNQLFTAAKSQTPPQPTTVWNDLKTVGATTMAGALLSVTCSEAWLEASAEASISKEILRVARLAALADDPTGRRKENQS